MRQALPALQYVQTAERGLSGDLGVSIEQSNATVPGDDGMFRHSMSASKDITR